MINSEGGGETDENFLLPRWKDCWHTQKHVSRVENPAYVFHFQMHQEQICNKCGYLN
jgi:hypothetical protein